MIAFFSKDIKRQNILNFSKGFTFVELLVVISLVSIISAIGVVNFKNLNDPLKNDVASFKYFISKVKLKAMSQTQAYKIACDDVKGVKVYTAKNCKSLNWNIAPTDLFILSDEVSFSKSGWSTCFNSRGFPSDAINVGLVDENGKQTVMNLMLGGAIINEE